MKFTQVATDAFSKIQLNAGVLLSEFDPSTATLDKTKIFAATGGGVNFTATPSFIDFGEDIDNVPNNTMELKQIDQYEVTISGTAKTMDSDFAKRIVAAADVSNGTITPRSTLKLADFGDIWWVGDYSDVTSGDDAGYMAIRLINALSTGGFQIQSNDNGKGDFAFTFTGHYSLSNTDVVPFEIYIKDGGDDDATLDSLVIEDATLAPSFNAFSLNYTAQTAEASGKVTATATDDGATVAIKNGGTSVTNGQSASWSTGANALTVTVTNGTHEKVYTVVVFRSA